MLMRLALFVLLALTPTMVSAVTKPAGIHRILVVYESDPTLFAATQIADGLHRSLAERMPAGYEIYSEYLDCVRFPDAAHVASISDYLTRKYDKEFFDVILTVGPSALRFMQERRSLFGSNTPLVFGAVKDNTAAERPLPVSTKGVVNHFDVGKTVELAVRLQPDAANIVVVTGSAPFDKSWQDSARGVLGDRYRGLPVAYLSGKSVEGFIDAARNMSSRTILLVLTVFKDANGRASIPRDVAAQIAAVSKAPVYGVYSSYIGTGAIGGYVSTFNSIGEQMGALAARIVNGDLSGPQITVLEDHPLVDWRAIRRFGIDPSRIPPDAEILNYEQSAWEKYRLPILAIAGVVLLQTATIVALALQYRRKKRLQAELSLERLELAYLSRTAQLGELSGALAHELNQPLTSILSNAEAATRLLEVEPLDLQEIKDIFADIVADDKRAAAVIAQLRSLMLRGETSRDIVDLNRAVTSTLNLVRSELIARQTRVEFLPQVPDMPVRANLVQLQQIVLNLVLNAAEAMSHIPYQERQITIQTRIGQGGVRELAVADRGKGVPPDLAAEIFKPFVSTKKKSLGLGLAICNSIALAHGGSLIFDQDVKKGARVVFSLPSP